MEKDERQQQDQRGEQKQDQPAHACADVLQAEEVEEAGKVVAEEAEQGDRAVVAARQRRLPLVAARPRRGDEEEGQREDHAQGQQRHRIGDINVGHPDEDRAQRKADHAANRERDADQTIGGVGLRLAGVMHGSQMIARTREAQTRIRRRTCAAGAWRRPSDDG